MRQSVVEGMRQVLPVALPSREKRSSPPLRLKKVCSGGMYVFPTASNTELPRLAGDLLDS